MSERVWVFLLTGIAVIALLASALLLGVVLMAAGLGLLAGARRRLATDTA